MVDAKKKATETPTKPAKPAESTQAAGLGLDSIGDLAGLLASTGSNGPLELPLDVIDEDQNQPRSPDNPGFSPESIAEIGETILLRGVKSPISVRENMERPGRYIINHGARRYRGSKLVGRVTIPAFIDNDYCQADQIIENLIRNELTAREIADFIGRGLASGKKKGEIAKEIGKSPAFVTQHANLLDLPLPIAEIFNNGRCRDVTVINELVTVYRKTPDEVATWLAFKDQEITRGSVKILREFLEGGNKDENVTKVNDLVDDVGEGGQDYAKEKKEPKQPNPDKLKKAIVQVSHDGRPAHIILTRRPSVQGLAWIKYEDDGQEREARFDEMQLVALLEG